jgi:hypothetical protein
MAIEPHVPRELRPSRPKVPFDKGHTTRRLCSFGLFFSIIVGIAFIVLGLVSKGSGNVFNFPPIGKELVVLLINIVITACTECLGLIHGTSLKWALFYEGRLEFNANLRLISSCRSSWPHSRIVNFVYLLSFALCNAAAYGPTCAGFLSHEHHQPLLAHESWPSLPRWRAVDAMLNMFLV